jgi:nitrogen fixation NifU-like protein
VDLERLLDRYEQPVRRRALPTPPARSASGTNPRCGDVVTMFVEVDGDRLARVSFTGAGCTISQVAADVTAELAEGRSLARLAELDVAAVVDGLGGRALVGSRFDCAGLGLWTLRRAVTGGFR